MIGIVIISHGDMAAGVLSSSKMILPGQSQFVSVCVREDTNPDVFRDDLEKAIQEVSSEEGTLVLTDLLGGTPCNVAITLLPVYDFDLVAGVNFPMVLSALTQRSFIEDRKELIKKIIDDGKKGIVHLNELLTKGE